MSLFGIWIIEKEKKGCDTMKKIKWPNILLLVAIAFIAWCVLSFIDTNIHNDIMSESYGAYAKWNLFNLIF